MMQEQETAMKTARVRQPLVCLGILAVIGLSAAAMEAAVHNEALGIWLDRKWAEANDSANEYKRQCLDTEDRIVLQDLVDLDPSSGGVYFFGASNMKWAMCVPDLPPEERKLVHNFGAGEGSPCFHQQFTEYLVKHKKLLQAGAGKTLVVYGTCFLNAKPAFDSPTTVFSNMWRRNALYHYDFRTGIEPIRRGAFWDAYLLEKARMTSFLRAMMDRGERLAVPKAWRRRAAKQDSASFAEIYKNIRMGPLWEKGFEEHRAELQEWLAYLRSQKIEFKIVLLPLASWHEPLPYPKKYHEMIAEFCRANNVPLIDLEKLVTDDDFVDHIHVNQQGLAKTDAALMDIARKFLKEKGIRPGE
jgi:hypothetical protein